MGKHNFLIIALLLLSFKMTSQEKILLYPKGAAESNELKNKESWRDKDFILDISKPRIMSFIAPAETANGTAVLICPGGGYSGVSVIKEGEEIAKWFNQLGVSAFVLYYRMPNGHYKIPLKDAQTAISIIRKNSKKWRIDKNKIGVMGFSAGGHLASTVGTHFRKKSQRPAFMILGYPVVTMDSTFTHKGSRNNLLGKKPSEELVKLYSNELQVKKSTPPTFIFHAKDDKTVPIKNSENLAEALKKNNIPVQLNEYEKGGHGFGMRPKGIDSDNWPEALKNWLKEQGFIE
ncbi:putative xylanase [uncultured Paludibacter sp.]|uniref:Putative xylanase n=1 Tax=uncultured Paludibacter sp. TaxID=497635 RepID=A0A653AG40_9BACT|nr:putative xylanase [uncultured Paludibacter sp.]